MKNKQRHQRIQKNARLRAYRRGWASIATPKQRFKNSYRRHPAGLALYFDMGVSDAEKGKEKSSMDHTLARLTRKP